jgi:DNA-binding MarR family transcriptional regulator
MAAFSGLEERVVASGRGEEAKAGDSGIVLGVLSAVERNSRMTQRHLARELNIALGLTNAYLKRCAKKGFIKIRQIPLNRYAYYLTPRGFAEKSRLTAEYLTVSLDFFRRARHDCTALMRACQGRGWQRIALYGAGELAEIAILSAQDAESEILCVIDAESGARNCAGRPIVRDFTAALERAGARGVDALVVTDSRAPQQSFDAALAAARACGLPAERVLAPDLLRVASPAARESR